MRRLLALGLLASCLQAATSYANPNGTGERRRTIIVTSTGPSFANTPSTLVDGDTTTNGRAFWSGTVSGATTLSFDFGDSAYVIDEAKFYQQSATAQGTWKWQGSNDGGGTWADIGGSFSITNATETITSMTGNVTAYKEYQMLGVSGTMSGGPWLYQVEFKISPIVSRTNGSTTSYSNTGGTGDRTGALSITAADNGGAFLTSTGTDTSAVRSLINGVFATTETSEGLDNPTLTGGYVQIDFGTPKVIDEAILWTGGNTGSFGTYKWSGSAAGSVFTNVATGIPLLVPAGGGGSTNAHLQIFRQLNSNTTAYRFWRMEVTAGAATTFTGMTELEFRIGDSPAHPLVSSFIF